MDIRLLPPPLISHSAVESEKGGPRGISLLAPRANPPSPAPQVPAPFFCPPPFSKGADHAMPCSRNGHSAFASPSISPSAVGSEKGGPRGICFSPSADASIAEGRINPPFPAGARDLTKGAVWLQSCRSAAIGSSCAACRAGYTPKAMPTSAQKPAESRIGSGAQATCQPANIAIR